jgi:hypothetical protein
MIEHGALSAQDRAAIFDPHTPLARRRGAEFRRLESIGVVAFATNEIEPDVAEIGCGHGLSNQFTADDHVLIIVADVVID